MPVACQCSLCDVLRLRTEVHKEEELAKQVKTGTLHSFASIIDAYCLWSYCLSISTLCASKSAKKSMVFNSVCPCACLSVCPYNI